MKRENNLSSDFTTGNIGGKLVRFMIPVLGALILQAMYGAVDLLVIGHFGSEAGISGIATGSNIINLVTVVISGLTMGLTVTISYFIGEQHNDRIGNIIGGAISFFVVVSLVLAVSLYIFAPQFAYLLNTPDAALESTICYVRICGIGMGFVVAYNVISGIFRGLGNSKLPLLFVAIACGVNIVGDLLLVAVFQMDVMGAALATVGAQAVSVILSIWIILKQPLPFKMSIKDVRFNKSIIIFLKAGLPIAVQDALTNLSFLMLCGIINNMGIEASSGYGVAQKIITFIMLIPSALMQSMSTFVGQNVGARKEKRARKAMYTGMGLGAGIGIFICVISIFNSEPLIRLFTSNIEYINNAAAYMKGFGIEPIITCVHFCFIGYFNGHGKTLPVMIQGITSSFLVRIPLSYIFSSSQSLVLVGAAVPLATIYGILFDLICYCIYLRPKIKCES